MSKVAVVRVVNDIRRPDYSGIDALDYCIERGLFHIAFRKGDVLVMSVDKYSDFWSDYTGGDFAKAFNCQFNASTDAASLTALKNFVKRHGLKDDISLADAIDERFHFVGITPTTGELELIRIIDGDVALKDFRLVEQE